MKVFSSQLSIPLPMAKSFKIDSTLDSGFFSEARRGNKIRPMPLISKKIGYEGDPKLLCKIRMKGYKHISRLAASGEYTIDILNKIKQTPSLKLIKSVDFDPYFCKTSGLQALSEVLRKLKRGIYKLTLILRRFTVKDELERFSPCLARLGQLKRLKIDFPDPQGIDAQDLRDLERSCKKCYSLRSVDVGLSGSKNVTKNVGKIQGLFRNSEKIEAIKSEVYFHHIEPSPLDHFKRKHRRKFYKNLKSFALKFAFRTSWASYFDGADNGVDFQRFLRAIPRISNPIHFSFISLKMQMPLEVLQALADTLPLLTNLRFVFLEFNNIKFSEFELVTLAKGFVDCKQITHLTFKYMDSVTIPMVDLIQFIIIMAKFSTFPKFDLFFRKLDSSEWQTPDVKKKLDDLGNIRYVLTRQSLHVQKFLSIENENM